MKTLSSLFKTLLLTSILLCCGCKSNPGQPITMQIFGALIMNDVVTEVVVLEDEGYVKVYLDKEKAKGLDASFGLEESDAYVIESIEREDFMEKFDEYVQLANLAYAPKVVFD
ncbi:MAG: hypothetical protein Roseis2KO_39510 [Roseivirga sp.]